MSPAPFVPRAAVLTLSAAALSVSLVACGQSDSASDSADPAASAACRSSVSEYLAPYQDLPTKISPDLTELPTPPPADGTIVSLVNGNIASELNTSKAEKEAADDLGWTFKQVVYDGTIEDLNAKYEQAIDGRPTAIITGGTSSATIVPALAKAAEEHVLSVINSGDANAGDDPGPAVSMNGLPFYARQGTVNANVMMDDADCRTTKVLVVSLPFPSLKESVKGFEASLKTLCPGCTTQVKELQAADLGTPAATNAIVAAVQSDPEIEYVYAVIGGIADGLTPALSAANLTNKVKVFGSLPSEQSVTALKDGTNAWWLTQDPVISGYSLVHGALLGLETGEPVNAIGHAVGILTPENIPDDATGLPSFPADFRDQFRTLWHLS